MDGLFFIAAALVFTLFIGTDKSSNNSNVSTAEDAEMSTDMSKRVVKLNDSFYDDPKAFMQIVNALGFPKER